MCAGDLGDEGVSPQQPKFAADPGRATAALFCIGSSFGKEDGAEIAIAEAVDGELAVMDGG